MNRQEYEEQCEREFVEYFNTHKDLILSWRNYTPDED